MNTPGNFNYKKNSSPNLNLSIQSKILGILLSSGINTTGFADTNNFSFNVWGGYNGSPDSIGTLVSSEGIEKSYDISWKGKSNESPPYYGLRIRYNPKFNQNIQFSLDFTHAKAQFILDGKLSEDFDRLEFTDGNNLLILNAEKHVDISPKISTYFGNGIGVSAPHAEVTTTSNSITGEDETLEYQYAGSAIRTYMGINYKVNNKISFFGELGIA